VLRRFARSNAVCLQFVLVIISIYIYSVFVFNFFRNRAGNSGVYFCDSLVGCFFNSLNFGYVPSLTFLPIYLVAGICHVVNSV